MPNPDYIGPCDPEVGCEIQHRWYNWTEEAMCFAGIPGTQASYACQGAWIVVGGMPPISAWTGFYPRTSPTDYTIGARILGQTKDDSFGTSVEYDGKFMYMGAPNRTALSTDVPELLTDRTNAGVIYRMRTNLEGATGGLGRLQLWVEPGRAFPLVDQERMNRADYTMPVPHQYIIETVGSISGNYSYQTQPAAGAAISNDCFTPTPAEVVPADALYSYTPYPASNSGYWVDRTPQIVGPHANANIGLVRALGDVDDDGNAGDFAVGCPKATADLTGGGDVVGGVFIAFQYPDPESNYLLDRIASLGAGRLRGVWLRGKTQTFPPNSIIGEAFDGAGDFNGDGISDVIVGMPVSPNNQGEVVVILGSRTLQSPQSGWDFDEVVAAGRAIRFAGAAAGDKAGFNVAGAGDVDGDGYADILIAAPGADGGAGTVYLIYGSDQYDPAVQAEYSLADAGTVDFPGVVFHGKPGSELGGGTVTKNVYHNGNITVHPRGLAALGDIDGDGLADVAISAIRAQPNGLQNAGEVYIYYGRGDLETR
ncbi:MAG: FG-GAP repeat protein [Planctomycetota bacterium]